MNDTIIKDEDVCWEMTWNKDRFPDMPEKETIFEASFALARLLAEEVVFLNSHWYRDDWPDDAKKYINVLVLCNDIFAWGCADAEDILYSEIKDFYDHWAKDPVWGGAVWCIKKRGEMPQYPVAEYINKAGIWDLSSMNLKENFYDAKCRELYVSNKSNST